MAPPSVREALSFASSDVRAALRSAPGIRRIVVLSTCHRVELYAELDGSADHARGRLIDWLASTRSVAREVVAQASIYLEGAEALRHLHRVAAGLDAALLGEAEIIAQVRAALQLSVAGHAASPALKAAFRSALSSAETARKTVWQRFPRADIGSIAVEAITAHLGPLTGRRALVVGAGRAGALAARALFHAGAELTVMNRSGERARAVADRFKARCAPFEHLAGEAAAADAIVVATGAPHVILDAPMLAGAGARDRLVVVVDTAMPRNADPAIASRANTVLVALDELHARTAAAHVERTVAAPEVEALTELAVDALIARSWVRTARRTLTIGTRGSTLARRQAEQVVAMLCAAHPDIAVRWRVYGSSGDEHPDIPFAELADDAFTDRIERALLDGEIDAAVHSYKDLPHDPVAGLVIAAVPVRADAREALVSRDGATLATLRHGAVIGTSSPRRAAALKALRPDCELRPIRGPVDVRLEKVLAGGYDAAIFALAGIVRLGLAKHVSEIFDASVIAPAAAQGALAVQCRERDAVTRAALASIDDVRLRAQVEAERATEVATKRLSADAPLGTHAPLHGRRVLVTRPAAQAQPLCDALEAVGAVPVRLALIRIDPIEPDPLAWHHLQSCHWVVFTSANGVEQAWRAAPPWARAELRDHAHIAAIGPATARAATHLGMMVQRVPTTHVAESLAAVLGDTAGQRVLWLRGERARSVLPATLREDGAEVIEVVVYRSVAAPVGADAAEIMRNVDIVTLASPSAVARFVELAGDQGNAPVACIGPVTAAAARTHGLRVAVVAESYTADGLVTALQRISALEATSPVETPAGMPTNA